MVLAPSLSQIIIAVHVCLWRCFQCECIRWIDLWEISVRSVYQPVQQVQNVGFGWHASLQRQFYGTQNGILIMVRKAPGLRWITAR